MDATTFEVAQMFSPFYQMKEVEICSQCHRSFTNSIDKEAIRDWGVCLSCDKINLITSE